MTVVRILSYAQSRLLYVAEDNQVRIVTSNGLPSVVKLLHSTSEALQEQGAGIMRNLAIDCENFRYI